MLKPLTLMAATLVSLGSFQFERKVDPVVAKHIEAMQSDGSMTNVVRELIETGLVCAVRGHDWSEGCGNPGCLVFHTAPIRHCVICKSTQTKEPEVWK